MTYTYKDAGVDVEKGDEFVRRIKDKVKKTYDKNVFAGVGGFASLYKIAEDKFLACGVDGVGTKLKIAKELNIHETIGYDLVAMCANDILCTGASPLFFMDYLACGKLDIEMSEQIIDGIYNACLENNLALVGGETAEMPGMYQNGDYDLAGFACGEVHPNNVIDGKNIKEGDSILALRSSGLHSNGYSLARKIIGNDKDILNIALTPTRLYWSIFKEIFKDNDKRKMIKGLAHITGGGVHNISRLNKDFDYQLINLIPENELPDIYSHIFKLSDLTKKEKYSTFNMGVGMVIITDKEKELVEYFESQDEQCIKLGIVEKGSGKVHF